MNPLPPGAYAYVSGAGPTSSFSSKVDDIIVSQISPFQSGALSWLENEATLTQLESTGHLSLPSSSSLPSQLIATTESNTASTDDSAWTKNILHSKKYKIDKVKRVIDASTIQLEKGGYVSLESVRGAGSTYQLPDCMDKAPSYKLKSLLPKGAIVKLVILNEGSSSTTPSPRHFEIEKTLPVKRLYR